MNRFLFYSLVSVISCLLGILAVWALIRTNTNTIVVEPEEIIVQADDKLAVVSRESPVDDEFKQVLDDVWVNRDETRIGGYLIKRDCRPDENEWVTCKLRISQHGKQLEEFESEHDDKNWLSYGFFNFLGGEKKQLIVHTYSGGAHCCYDYYIFDLTPRFRTIYSSAKFDSGNEIGSELVPVDIDGDGVFEFHRRVESFAYFYASYADSNKPTALFAYDSKKQGYQLANKKFPEYILADNERGLEWFAKNEPELNDLDRRYIVRMEFLNFIYSGHKKEGWQYFENNYVFDDKKEYSRDIKKELAHDPTYKSIYGH